MPNTVLPVASAVNESEILRASDNSWTIGIQYSSNAFLTHKPLKESMLQLGTGYASNIGDQKLAIGLGISFGFTKSADRIARNETSDLFQVFN